MLSDLAQHSMNIAADDRVSLLFDADPLAGARLTVIGRAARCEDERALARYVGRHPTAARYAGFADFHLYRVAVERGHFVAGFGNISWIPPQALVLSDVGEMAEIEAGALEHMNRDHAGTIDLYARELLGRDGEGWRLTGVDPDGCDLARGTKAARLDFPEPVLTAEALRAKLAQLARDARA
jgi:putative heme iron utilization protein